MSWSRSRPASSNGRFRQDDPFTVACALWVSLHGLTSLLISRTEFPWPLEDPGELFERFFGLMLEGLLAS